MKKMEKTILVADVNGISENDLQTEKKEQKRWGMEQGKIKRASFG